MRQGQPQGDSPVGHCTDLHAPCKTVDLAATGSAVCWCAKIPCHNSDPHEVDVSPRPEVLAAMISMTLSAQVLAQQPPGAAHAMPPQAPASGANPRVSPDGKSIVFTSDRDGTSNIYVMNADGSSQRRVTPEKNTAQLGGWAGDSRHVIYLRRGADSAGVFEVDVMSGAKRLILSMPNALFPAVSPDRHSLVFTAGTFPNVLLYSVTLGETSGHVPLTQDGANFGAAWSPDGKRIAYSSIKVAGAGPKIFVVNADGSDAHQLSSGDGSHELPQWSPDGRRIAFQSSVRGRHHAEVFVVDADGTNQRQVTTHAEDYLMETPSWFRDGKRLAIQSDRDGAMSVYVIDLAGNVMARLTQ